MSILHFRRLDTIRNCFFFQAEDGIRDVAVTGVQTCALPICAVAVIANSRGVIKGKQGESPKIGGIIYTEKNGRASWRGRGEISVVAVSLKKKKKFMPESDVSTNITIILGAYIRMLNVCVAHI